jgi:endonuclease/exonuclease/phosphatase (EEP) superfamily protein YafD
MRKRLAAALLLCHLTWGCGYARPRVQAVPHFSLLTYNVNFAGPRKDLAIRAIANADADVVCLQETTPEWELVVRDSAGAKYPFIHFRHEPGAGGMAVLSKWEMSAPVFHRAESGWFPACIMTVKTPAGAVQVVSVHLHPPVSERGSFASGYFTTRPMRRGEIEEIHALTRQPEVPSIFAGDFNESGGGGAVLFLSRRGYQDALRIYAPYASTWRWQVGPLPLRGQLDHVLYDRSLRCLDARVLREGASDHYPVLAAFRFRDTPAPATGRSSNSLASNAVAD